MTQQFGSGVRKPGGMISHVTRIVSTALFCLSPILASAATSEEVELCNTGWGFLEASSSLMLENDFSKQEVAKLWTIEREKGGDDFAGESGDIFEAVGHASVIIASTYSDPTRLEVEWTHRCLTGDGSPGELMLNWAGELVSAVQADENSLRTQGDLVDPRDHRKLLGDQFESGLVGLDILTRREAGQISACSFQFSHSQFEDLYASGGVVKTSGTINLMVHPTLVVMGMLKLKGEDLHLRTDGQVLPATFKIGGTYLTSKDQPLIENAETMACDDDDYICHVNSDGLAVLEALTENEIGFAYNRAGGSSDVSISINPVELEGGVEKMDEFYTCLEGLNATIRARFAASVSD